MIPLYRYVKYQDDDAVVGYTILELNYFAIKINNVIYVLNRVAYGLPCYPDRHNNVHHYLTTDAYHGDTNIVGFLKYDRNMINPTFNYLHQKFRTNRRHEEKNRLVFITGYELQHDNVLNIGGKEFKHIVCPSSGTGVDQVTTIRGEDYEVSTPVKHATCDNDEYPTQGCPATPVAANLGELMPGTNRLEVNLIGNVVILGVLLVGFKVQGGLYYDLSSTEPYYVINGTNKSMIPTNTYIELFLRYMSTNQRKFRSIINPDIHIPDRYVFNISKMIIMQKYQTMLRIEEAKRDIIILKDKIPLKNRHIKSQVERMRHSNDDKALFNKINDHVKNLVTRQHAALDQYLAAVNKYNVNMTNILHLLNGHDTSNIQRIDTPMLNIDIPRIPTFDELSSEPLPKKSKPK